MTLDKPSTARSAVVTMCPACTFTSWKKQSAAVDHVWEHIQAEHPATARRLSAAARSDRGHERTLAENSWARPPTSTPPAVGNLPAIH